MIDPRHQETWEECARRLYALLQEVEEAGRGTRTYRGKCDECPGNGCRGHETETQVMLREGGIEPKPYTPVPWILKPSGDWSGGCD